MAGPRRFRYKLSPGDRISILGGYEEPPTWLAGKDRILGTVRQSRLNRSGDAIVELDEDLLVPPARGRFLILAPRFKQRWWSPGWSRVVHLELHERMPTAEGKGSGEWIESHAHYRILPSR